MQRQCLSRRMDRGELEAAVPAWEMRSALYTYTARRCDIGQVLRFGCAGGRTPTSSQSAFAPTGYIVGHHST